MRAIGEPGRRGNLRVYSWGATVKWLPAVLLLAGCAGGYSPMEGTADGINFKVERSASQRSVSADAETHCQQFGKHAVLVRSVPAQEADTYEFACR
jgi:putative hemolysin